MLIFEPPEINIYISEILNQTIVLLLHISLVEQEYLDNFKDKQEFWYVSKDASESEKGNTPRQDDRWWLPTVRVPPGGLSDASRKWVQHQKDLVNQVLKAAMAINANVLMEMDVPEAYIESLPKVINNTTLHKESILTICNIFFLVTDCVTFFFFA